MQKFESLEEEKLVHDINGTLSSLLSAFEVINAEWKINTTLVDKMIPLTFKKLDLFKEQFGAYQTFSKK